jgi:hypothetical protein
LAERQQLQQMHDQLQVNQQEANRDLQQQMQQMAMVQDTQDANQLYQQRNSNAPMEDNEDDGLFDPSSPKLTKMVTRNRSGRTPFK